MMTPTLANVLQLSVAERIQLVEDIWDSMVAMPETLPITEAQRQELDRRLEAHRQTPEASMPWAEVKKRIRRAPSITKYYSDQKQKLILARRTNGMKNKQKGLVRNFCVL